MRTLFRVRSANHHLARRVRGRSGESPVRRAGLAAAVWHALGMTASMMLFTRDLRMSDNPALSAAVASGPVIPAFVLDDRLLAACAGCGTRLAFLTDSLRDLDAGLRAAGGALVVRRGAWVPEVMAMARQGEAGTIHVADDVSGYAQRRLAALERTAAAERMTVVRHPGVTVVPPGALRPAGGSAYRVFTPYYRRWLAAPRRPAAATPARITLPSGVPRGRLPALAALTTAPPAAGRAPGGERSGQARLRAWAAASLAGYDAGRDDLAADRVSRLSPYLHLGCLSPAAVEAALAGRAGAEPFIRRLAWRDFFSQLLADRPETARQDYRGRGDRWHQDPAALAAWQDGQTGFPVVDAGMRQLRAEGFMPNRARMIVASFLTRDLYLDWRDGAAHFMRLLADADVACNQLNWQWVAGTGTDTNPSRVFNPTVQGRRFDPAGDYVRRYVPELAALPAPAIHDPAPADRRRRGYPAPLVDHHAAITEYRARLRGH
jgi:deoxyribodipyrimidine photo-lyase